MKSVRKIIESRIPNSTVLPDFARVVSKVRWHCDTYNLQTQIDDVSLSAEKKWKKCKKNVTYCLHGIGVVCCCHSDKRIRWQALTDYFAQCSAGYRKTVIKNGDNFAYSVTACIQRQQIQLRLKSSVQRDVRVSRCRRLLCDSFNLVKVNTNVTVVYTHIA